jgi:periplasmic protein CpxP/Spy
MTFKKTTTLWLIIMVLVLVNLATLGSLWLSQPDISSPERGQRPSRPGFFIEQRLNFSEEQAALYRQLRQEYFDSAKNYYDEIKKEKEALFQHLKYDNGQNIEEIATRIGKLQAQIEILTFEHFLEIRKMSNEEQKAQLDSLMVRIVDRAVRPFPRGEGERERQRPSH